MKRFLISSIIFSILILTANACASTPTTINATNRPTATQAPTTTETATAEASATPVETLTPEQMAWKELFTANGFTFALEKITINDVVVEGLKMDGDKLTITFPFPELGGEMFAVRINSDQVSFNADGSINMPGLEFDGQKVSQEHVIHGGKETELIKQNLDVVIELMRRDAAAFIAKFGDAFLDPNSQWRREVKAVAWELMGLDGKTASIRYEGMQFRTGENYVFNSKLYLVDRDGNPVKDEEGGLVKESTMLYAYGELWADGQTYVTWVDVSGVQKKYIVDAKLGDISYYSAHDGVGPLTVVQD